MKKKVVLTRDPEVGMVIEPATKFNLKRAKNYPSWIKVVEIEQDLLSWYEGAKRSFEQAQGRLQVVFDSAPSGEAK